MLCSSCREPLAPGARFCSLCGTPVVGDASGDPSVVATAVAAVDEPTPASLPTTPAMPTMPPLPTMPTLPDLPPVGDLPPVEVAPPSTATAWPMPVTGELPVVVTAQPFRITWLVLVSVVAGVTAVASALFDLVSYRATGGLLDSFTWRLNDLASNLLVGTVVAAVAMVVGACVGATGRRVGSGLAGGAGLALAGMLGAAAGSGVALLDATKVRFVTSGAAVTLTTTYDIGWILAVVAAGLGGMVFLASLPASVADGRRRLDTVTALVGVLGAVAMAVGPLIPGVGGSWRDNIAVDDVPPVAISLRLLPLVLVLFGALVGFFARRRWGLGVVLGAVSVGAWQTVTAFSGSGDLPYGLAGGNPGVVDAAHPFRPHVVTTAGLAVVMTALVVNSVVAFVRRRPAKQQPAGKASAGKG